MLISGSLLALRRPLLSMHGAPCIMSAGNVDLGEQLADPLLFRQQAFINGLFVGADSQGTIEVLDPASNRAIGTVPDMGAAEAR